jgi:ribonuclease HI
MTSIHTVPGADDPQVAEALAAEYETLSPHCRADADRLRGFLAPDFHEFGASGAEVVFEGTAERVAACTDPDGEPFEVERMRGVRLADGLVMLKYTVNIDGRWSNRTSLWRRVAPGRWQLFHNQGTPTRLPGQGTPAGLSGQTTPALPGEGARTLS